MRKRTIVNESWLFTDSDIVDHSDKHADDICWEHIDVPHDWAINTKIHPPDNFEENDLINPSNYRWKA